MLVTLELVLSLVLLAVVLGLISAGAKPSRSRPLAMIFEGYTTLIRGVLDLVLMMLIFFGLQIALNTVTDVLGVAQFDIDPDGRRYHHSQLYLRRLFHGNVPRCVPGGVKRADQQPRRSALPDRELSAAFCSRR